MQQLSAFTYERKVSGDVSLSKLLWMFVVGLVGFYYLPYPVLLFNSFTPWKIVHHPVWFRIMDIRRALFRAETDPVPLQEIAYKDLTYEKFMELTEDLSKPLVIRNVWDVDHLQKLSSVDFWSKNYGNSTVTCVDVKTEEYSACTINELINYRLQGKKKIYSRTNHQILYENPELLEMFKLDLTNWIGAPDTFHEMFIGFEESGSPLHAEITGNFQKQITGRKKWTMIAPSELPFCNLYVTEDGGSLLAYKATSWSNAAWLRYVNRFEVIVEPGDVLFNPTMWLHIVENIPAPKEEFSFYNNATSISTRSLELVIGAPERWVGVKYAMKTSYFLTAHLVFKKLMIKAYQKMHGIKAEKTGADFLPMKDAATAKGFDEYLRGRARELRGKYGKHLEFA